MLIATPQLDADDLRVLEEIEEYRQKLRFQVREHRKWEGQLRRSLVANAIQGSNSIEGIHVSSENAAALVERQDMSADVDDQTRRAVEGYCDALTWVQQSVEMKNFSYHEMMLSTLHFMIQKYELREWPGRYREGNIWVTGRDPLTPAYTGPDPDLVPGLMAEMVDWLNNGDLESPALVRASMAHLNLVSIHPWRDGNGRMSRCLHTLVLAQDKVLAPEFSSIEEWLGDPLNTQDYYRALQTTRPTWEPQVADAHQWMRFCLRAHHQQAQSVQRRVDRASMLWSALEAVVVEHELDERMVSALYAAAVGELRRATYAKDESLTRDQSVRDLQRMRQHGLVRSIGHARTQRYVADGELAEINMAVMDQLRRPLDEPYGS
ncbi:Fic family protein [Kutzneria sp. NPDC051319]|uniref:Fic family protein n=1 Tax=Kutzneria sp. NPDC051319 TaxID=3155047 RepID=UPI0034263B3B